MIPNTAQPAETETETAVSAEPVTTESDLPSSDKAPERAKNLSEIKGYYKQTTASRPKNLDLRHCLELESNIEIAKCAGE